MKDNAPVRRGYAVYFRLAYQVLLVVVVVALVQRSRIIRQWVARLTGETTVTRTSSSWWTLIWSSSALEEGQRPLLFSAFEQNPSDRFPWDDNMKYAFAAVGIAIVVLAMILGT